MKRYPAYNDLSKMPFGSRKGELMRDIDEDYLTWLYEDMEPVWGKFVWSERYLGTRTEEQCKVFNYIHNKYFVET